MKKLLFIIALCCLGMTLSAATPDGWMTDYDAALKKAEAEKKFVYVLFTGSDWCHWCKKLRNDVLEKKAFQKFAKEKMILVYCDFPRKQQLPREQMEKQKKWFQQLNESASGVPSAVIVTSDGKVAGRISGYMSAKNYIKKLKSITK